ncbi:MAG: BatA domain-containing protein, partial [Planctomycetales bacterium]|nr:BatA domain-containing protein [Planctomycetales bacterium]
MSFLSGIFLMAIPLVGLPVILHFYKRQQRDVVHWGAMQFLTDAAIEGRRFERIEELVLMLLRALAVAALVFAMAQPLVQNSWIGASTEQDVILILDDSMSMARAVDGESSFDKMQEHVAKLLGDLTDKDSVQIMLASGGGRWLTSAPAPGNARSTNELQATIADLNPTLGATDLFSCLQWAIDTEPTTAARSRRVVVFTDSQVFGWHVDASGPWQQLRESCQTAGSDEQSFVPTSIQVVDCSSQESSLDNLAVVRLEASRTLTGSGDPVTFTVELKNVGKTASQSTTLKWFVDGNRISDSSIPSLEAGES